MLTSAKIYDFPARGRYAQVERRDNAMPATNLASPRIAKVAVSGAWYHDEAIEAEQSRNN